MKSKLHYASITLLWVILCLLVPNLASAQTCTVRTSSDEARLVGGSNRIDGIFVKWSGDFNPYTWFEMNNYVQRHLQSVRLKDVATGSEGEIFNSSGAKGANAWFPTSGTGWFFTEILGDDLARIRPGFGGGLTYTADKEYEFIFVLDNSSEAGAAEVWVTGYSKSDANYANGENYEVSGGDQHRKVTFAYPTCTVVSASADTALCGASYKGGALKVKFDGSSAPSVWLKFNDYAARNLKSIRIRDTVTGTENYVVGTDYNYTGAANGSWCGSLDDDKNLTIRPYFGYCEGLGYVAGREYELLFTYNASESGTADVSLVGFANGLAESPNTNYNIVDGNKHSTVTFSYPSCTVVSSAEETAACGEPYKGGALKVKFTGSNYPSLWLTFNDFAAHNLKTIRIRDTETGDENDVIGNYSYDNATGEDHWWCGSLDDDTNLTIRPYFGYCNNLEYEAGREYELLFTFNVATQGKAEMWVAGYEVGEKSTPNANYAIINQDKHSTIEFKLSPYKVKQIETYVGRGNKNEPLLTLLDTFDGTQMSTLKFKPFGTGLDGVERYKIYAREYPKEGTTFYGENGIDIGIFLQSNPNKWGDVLYLGEATADGDVYSFTLESPLNGKYYLVVTADVKDSAKEGTTIGAALQEYNGETPLTGNSESKYREVVISRHPIFIPFDGYSNFYRIPAIITGDDGRMMVTSDARKFHNHDVRNDIDVLARYSTDNGATWSNPLVVAQGKGMETTDSACGGDEVVAFGDAALSNLPTPGHMVAAVISGDPLTTDKAGARPTIYYMTSTNNGVTWSEPKMIPQDLFTATTGPSQGCPSPGRMCLVKEGKLKGKVLGSFYLWENSAPKTLDFFTYDESEDKWERVGEMDLTDAGITNAGWRGGESQFVEIGENELILSSRVDSGSEGDDYYRSWFYCNVADGTVKLTHINSKFVDWLPVTSCSNMVTYKQPETGKTYFLQCMATETSNYENNGWSCRNNVRLKYAEFKGAEDLLKNGLTWQTGRSITKGMATAGYSCLTVQQNGTIGFVSEDYPVAYYYKSCWRGGDALLGITYTNFSVEWLSEESEEKLKTVPLANVTIAAPVINPLTGTFAVDGEGKLLREGEKHTFANGSIKVDEVPTLNAEAGEDHYAIEYVIALTKAGENDNAGKTITIKSATAGKNVGNEAVDLTAIIDNLASGDNKVRNLDQITISARTVVCDTEGKVVRSSVYATETYRAVNPGRVVKVIVKAVNQTDERLLKAANMKPSMIVNGKEYVAEFGAPISQIVGINQKVALFANNNKIGHLKGFSLHANTYVTDSLSKKDVFNAYVVSDGSQHQFVMPTVENYAGNACDLNSEEHKDVPVVVYAWYEVPGGGLYQRADGDTKDEHSDKNGVWNSGNGTVDENMTDEESGNFSLDKPSDKNNAGAGLDLIDTDSDDATLTLTLIPDVVSVYNTAYVVVRKNDGTLLKNSDGKVVYRRFTGIFGAESAGAKRRANEVIGADAVELSSENWYDPNTNNPKKVTATFTIGKELNSGKTTATNMATIETYVVADQSVTAQQAAEQAVYNVTQTVTSRIPVPLDVETVEEELVAEAPALTVTTLGGGEVMFESTEPIEVSVYNVAGSLVARFPLDGKQVKRLAQGFYIAGDVKFVVK